MINNWRLLAAMLAFTRMAAWSQMTKPLEMDFQQLAGTHDIQLPAWGPFSKKYAGISHIPDLKAGLRFDVSVLPGYYRSRVLIPNVLFESGYYPWDVSEDMTRVTYRYELEWKDRVFVDVTYSTLASNAVLAAMRCVNNSALPQNLVLNLMASLDYPETFPAETAKIPSGLKWINAVDYQQLSFAHRRPTDNLVYDGWMRGEARSSEYLEGRAVARGFGKDRGDTVSYVVPVPPGLRQGTISIRFRLKENSRVAFQCSGLADCRMDFVGTGKFEMLQVPFSSAQDGEGRLALESEGGSAIEINGFFIGPQESSRNIAIVQAEKKFTPELKRGGDKSLILKYADLDVYYGIGWDFSPFVVREFLNDELDIFFRKNLQDHAAKKFTGNGRGHYADVFLRPIELAPNSSRTVYALICNGTLDGVRKQLASFSDAPQSFIAKSAPEDNPFANILPAGEKYVFSQKMLRAVTLANVVYPIYTQGGYIRHFTPGKWWNSLYTWDDGFIALGLSEINRRLAVQCLNAYTTPPGSQSAFIHHGSPVPVQVYAFFDLWNKTQSGELSAYFYPRLKQYYQFLAGEAGSSTTRSLRSNLLKTWDYFYNSGGWDDYPAQKAVHDQQLEKWVAPAITTAQCIRVAKILRMAAESLLLTNDLKGYDVDIKTFSDALQNYSWDSAGGYFSYVVHDENGNPTGHFKHSASGQNYNMGLDGAYPLFSGICTPEQQNILLGKIFSTTNMWTPSGICVVDQSAPYYRSDGYWNGAVWMPHQWFMWKTMLDLGRPDLAWKIAQKALDVWENETDESYFTFEHFLAKNGRGAGWHQFSALSTPVLSWFSAYFKPGTFTTGFEVRIKKQSFAADYSGCEAELAFDKATAPHQRSLLVCLNPANDYVEFFNGKKVELTSPHKGFVQINLPPTNDDGRLVVKPVGG
jgi:hypothetical protein